ncbi:MAG: hypothetical protein HON33_05555, partial [Flavobacteriaceae bacterium]|nr:hypothetical protein [Flavobacteriaceae bacterium]
MSYFQLPKFVEINLKFFLLNLVAFLSTIPFLAPIPIATDIQYPIFIICAVIVFLDFISKKIILLKFEVYFIGLALLSFIYINPLSDYDYRINKCVGIFFAFLVFYVFRRYWRLMNAKYFAIGIYLNAFVAFLEIIQFEIYLKLVTPFVRVIKFDSGESDRGVHGLMAEPSFLAGMGAFFCLISIALYYETRISKKSFIFQILVSLTLIILSSSITGLMFIFPIIFVVLLLTKIKTIDILLFFLISVLILFYFTFMMPELDFRAIDFIRDIIINPSSILSLEDRSIALRMMSLIAAYESIVQGNILGFGIGTMQYVTIDLLRNSLFFSDFLGDNIYFSGAFISSLSLYVIEIGIFFIIFLLWIYSSTKFIAYAIYIRIISILYLLFTFSILFP